MRDMVGVKSLASGVVTPIIGGGQKLSLSLVIPFYNEEKNVRSVVNGLIAELGKADVDYQLVLVNNGSVDDTPQILEDLARDKPDRITVAHVPVNQGYGWGIINGLKLASGEFVGHMCGDGQIKPQDVLKVFDSIKKGNYGLAKVKRVSRRDGIIRRMLSVSYNLLFQFAFSVKTLDVNGSPKILKREYMDRISPVSKDWFIDAEIMIKAKYLNLTVAEVPVDFLCRERGRSHVDVTTIWEFTKNIFSYKLGRRIKTWKQKTLK